MKRVSSSCRNEQSKRINKSRMKDDSRASDSEKNNTLPRKRQKSTSAASRKVNSRLNFNRVMVWVITSRYCSLVKLRLDWTSKEVMRCFHLRAETWRFDPHGVAILWSRIETWHNVCRCGNTVRWRRDFPRNNGHFSRWKILQVLLFMTDFICPKSNWDYWTCRSIRRSCSETSSSLR